MFSLTKCAAFAVPAMAAVAVCATTGCAKPVSPAVGTWTGQTPMKTPASLTLAADGTGSVSIPPVLQSKPVTWKEGENKKIDISLAPAASGSSGTPSAASNFTLSAFVGDDKKTMTLAFPAFNLTLNKADSVAK